MDMDYGQHIPGPDEHIKYYVPEYHPLVKSAMNKLINEDIPMDYEAEYLTVKGNRKWCHILGRGLDKTVDA